jgi:hypothetical protein
LVFVIAVNLAGGHDLAYLVDMVDMPDIPDPHPSLVAKEVSEVLADYGPATTPEDLERLARGAEANAKSYDGGPALAHAVAAELRRRADHMRRGGIGPLI